MSRRTDDRKTRKPARPSSGRSTQPTLADERSAAQAGAAERKAAAQARLDERFGDDTPGSALIVASWVAAAAVTLTGLAGWAFGGPFEIAALIVSLVLFFAGMVIFTVVMYTVFPVDPNVPDPIRALAEKNALFKGWVFLSQGIGFVVAASRSRRDQLDLGRLALLTGVAPRRVRNSLFGALVVQIIGGLVPAIATKGLELDFGTLVPLVGVGLIFWWGAAYGDFPPRPELAR